jgi:hypothetical protein
MFGGQWVWKFRLRRHFRTRCPPTRSFAEILRGRTFESKDRMWSLRHLGWAASAALEDDLIMVLDELACSLLE